jgi:hypothetical protein
VEIVGVDGIGAGQGQGDGGRDSEEREVHGVKVVELKKLLLEVEE